MTEIQVWVYGRTNPIIFEDVEEVYDKRGYIEIVQLAKYCDTVTKFYKQSIQYWKKIETR